MAHVIDKHREDLFLLIQNDSEWFREFLMIKTEAMKREDETWCISSKQQFNTLEYIDNIQM